MFGMFWKVVCSNLKCTWFILNYLKHEKLTVRSFGAELLGELFFPFEILWAVPRSTFHLFLQETFTMETWGHTNCNSTNQSAATDNRNTSQLQFNIITKPHSFLLVSSFYKFTSHMNLCFSKQLALFSCNCMDSCSLSYSNIRLFAMSQFFMYSIHVSLARFYFTFFII